MWITSLLFDLNYESINRSFAFSPGQTKEFDFEITNWYYKKIPHQTVFTKLIEVLLIPKWKKVYKKVQIAIFFIELA